MMITACFFQQVDELNHELLSSWVFTSVTKLRALCYIALSKLSFGQSWSPYGP